MNIVDQERQKFEQWLRAQPHVLNVGFNKLTQEYLLSEDQDQWIGWQAHAQLSLKAEARIEELENALQELYLASGPVANCAYNVGQRHEDWENIKQYIDKLDSARLVAVNVFKEKK